MKVSSYIFESPYSSPIQIGKLNASQGVAQDVSKDSNTQAKAEQSLQNSAEHLVETHIKEVAPAKEMTTVGLDTYA